MSYCELEVDHISNNKPFFFYADSDVKGKLTCYFYEPSCVKSIKVLLTCEEYVEWMGYVEKDDVKSETKDLEETTLLTGYHEILRVVHTVFINKTGKEIIKKGKYTYNFKVTLPENIPSSFNGKYGSVYYKIRGFIIMPDLALIQSNRVIINVKSLLDITEYVEESSTMTVISNETTISRWCLLNRKISMDVQISKDYFIPGEEIDLKINVYDQCLIRIGYLEIILVRIVTCCVTTPYEDSKKDIKSALLLRRRIGKNTMTDFAFALPKEIRIPNFTKCQLFDVTYELKVSYKAFPCAKNDLISIVIRDIKIGNLLLAQSCSSFHAGIMKTTKSVTFFDDKDHVYEPSKQPVP